jgi:general secretion pathway protein F
MQFLVTAYNESTGVERVWVQAENPNDALRQIRATDRHPISVTRSIFSFRGLRQKKLRSIEVFCQQLQTLVDGGSTVVQAIEVTARSEKEGTPGRELLDRILEELGRGQTLSAAMHRSGGKFPPLLIATIRSAETTGTMSTALKRYLEHETRIARLRNKMITASIYPLLLIGVGSSVLMFMLLYVIPRFSVVFSATPELMSGSTAAMIEVGSFIGGHRWTLLTAICIIILASGALAVRAYLSGDWIAIGLRAPLIQDAIRHYQLARMYRTLSTLLDGGIPLIAALRTASDLLSHGIYVRAIARTIRRLASGESVALAFEAEELSTSIGARILASGERSGGFALALDKAAEHSEAALNAFVERLERVVEPVLMVIIGLLIGIVVLMMYMPVFDLAGSLQ